MTDSMLLCIVPVSFVKFDKVSSAALAMEKLDGVTLDNGHTLKVMLATARYIPYQR